MLNRLASQTNLISTSPSFEISDQCLFESNLIPETGSRCQSGGNPVLINSCAKYLSSPFRMRSASATAFRAERRAKPEDEAPARRKLKKNLGECPLRHCA